MGNAAGRSLRTLAGCREAHAPWDAGGGSRVHTYKQLLQPNIHAAFRPIEGCCVFIETQEPSRLKTTSRARFRTLQLQLRGV
jgi:hypothetical protein